MDSQHFSDPLRYDQGHFFTFRPFVRNASHLGDPNETRKRLRAKHRLAPEGFLVTVATDPCTAGDAQVKMTSSSIIKLFEKRFQEANTSWLVVIFGKSHEKKMKNFLFLSDQDDKFHRYLLAADLHVSLTRADFALDALHARSLAVPTVMLGPSEMACASAVEDEEIFRRYWNVSSTRPSNCGVFWGREKRA